MLGAAFRPMRDPQTRAEWQEAADAAQMMLALESCKLYGLLQGGPHVNVMRCEEILERARAKGIDPRPVEEELNDGCDASKV